MRMPSALGQLKESKDQEPRRKHTDRQTHAHKDTRTHRHRHRHRHTHTHTHTHTHNDRRDDGAAQRTLMAVTLILNWTLAWMPMWTTPTGLAWAACCAARPLRCPRPSHRRLQTGHQTGLVHRWHRHHRCRCCCCCRCVVASSHPALGAAPLQGIKGEERRQRRECVHVLCGCHTHTHTHTHTCQ